MSASRWSFAVALGLNLAGVPRASADVCGCVPEPRVCPYASQTLPLNARLFASVPGVALETLTLMDPNGSVPTRVSPSAGAPHQVWVEPIELLRPRTEYRLVAIVRGEERTLATYTSIKIPAPDGLDRRAPYFSGVAVHPGGLSNQCQIDKGLLSASITSTTDSDQDGLHSVVQVDVTDGTNRGTLFLCGVPYSPTYESTFGHSLQDPGNECYQDLRLPFGEPNKVYSVKATAWDAGGNSTVVDGLQVKFGVPQAFADLGSGNSGPQGTGGSSGGSPAPASGAGLPLAGQNGGSGPAAEQGASGCALAPSGPALPAGAPLVAAGLVIAAFRRRQTDRRRG
jgi:hypothetical protein